MDKGALYLRLSKEDIDKIDKGDDSESITNQRLLLTDYAIEHNIQIVDIYSDDDYSGLYDDRPEFDRLIQDSRLGRFNVVIAKSQSRFTRNMEHMEKYLHHDFPLLGIRFIGLVDGIDTSVKGNKKARQIYGLTNEWYCEDLSENIRTVFKQKMRAGQFLGAFSPYGYCKAPKNKHLLIVDEEAAQVVRKIFYLYLQGHSVRQICHILEDEGIANPTVYKKQQGLAYSNARASEFSEKYNFWSETTVKRILGNETYIGKLTQGVCEKLSYKDKKVVAVPKEKWIVVENHHEPIVDLDTFEKVRGLRSKRRVSAQNQDGQKKNHMFAGKIRCSSCGATMIKSGGVRGRENDWYLRCQLANKSRLKECTSHNILYSVIEKKVLECIQSLVFPILENPSDRDEIAGCIEKLLCLENPIQLKRNHLKELQCSLKEHEKAFRLLYVDRVTGSLTEEVFSRLKEDFEEETQRITLQIQSLEEEVEIWKRKQQKKDSVQELLNQYCDYSKLTHEIAVDFIDYIEISEKETNSQKITIHWNV